MTATPSDEDSKLVSLARSARARIRADHGAAVRDETGRSYSGADVVVGELALTALQLAVAQARAAGAATIEAAAVVGEDPVDIGVLRHVGGAGIPVWRADAAGTVADRLVT